MKEYKSIHGGQHGLENRHTVSCSACPGWTFNAGMTCTDCLNRDCPPVPIDLRGERGRERLSHLGAFPKDRNLTALELGTAIWQAGRKQEAA